MIEDVAFRMESAGASRVVDVAGVDTARVWFRSPTGDPTGAIVSIVVAPSIDGPMVATGVTLSSITSVDQVSTKIDVDGVGAMQLITTTASPAASEFQGTIFAE